MENSERLEIGLRQQSIRLALRYQKAEKNFQIALRAHQTGNINRAVKYYLKAIKINPQNPKYLNNMGVAYRALGKSIASLACYYRSLSLAPRNSGILTNLGNALREIGDLEKAKLFHEKSVLMDPGNADAIYNLGLTLRDLGRPKEALGLFDKSRALDPRNSEYEWDRALTLLLLGYLKEGFTEYECRWRLERNKVRRSDKPLWDGSSLEGKTILIYQEQGFGDTIQFSRYIEKVGKAGGTVVIEVASPLLELMSGVKGVDLVVDRNEDFTDFDYHIPMLSLPYVFATELSTIPKNTPYIFAQKERKYDLTKLSKNLFNIGFAWAGSPTHQNDKERSCGILPFISTLELPSVSLYSLQTGAAAQELSKHNLKDFIIDLGSDLKSFADTALIVQELDLIITVDTALAHLAGAMCKPVWVLLPYAPDWRWMLEKEDSPWYESMRLFRQPAPSDWDGAFCSIRKALWKKVHQHIEL